MTAWKIWSATTKRHPSRTRHRTAVSRDGKILGGEIDFTIDGGAYATLSSVVLSRGAIHAGGPYYWPMRSHSREGGRYQRAAPRRFSWFRRAAESVRDGAAHGSHRADTRPFSRRNPPHGIFCSPGRPRPRSKLCASQSISGDCWTAHWRFRTIRPKKQRFAKENHRGSIKKGMGIAAFLHGAGFTGSGERYLSSVVGVEGCPDGRVRVLVSSTEFGQGTKTVLSQIAAEALSLPYENVSMAQPDTLQVPNSGPTVASRTVMVVGKLVQSAAFGIRQTLISSNLLGAIYTAEEFRSACRQYVSEHGQFRSWSRYEAPADIFWDDQKVSWRSLRGICLGGLHRRSHSRSDDLQRVRG
jgi:hypothetical protein